MEDRTGKKEKLSAGKSNAAEDEKKLSPALADGEDGGEDDVSGLFEPERISVPLTKDNARIFKGEGGLTAMEFVNHRGEKELVGRVVVYRCFPVTNPDEFLSVREPDSKVGGKGKELGMIRRLSDMDPQSAEAIKSELELRYFSPEILSVFSVRSRFGYFYWKTKTTSGDISFVVNNPFTNIRVLEDGRMLIKDIEGNNFVIPDPKKLDAASRKLVEIYL